MKAYIFPGQGSQIKGMGAELFTEFKEHVKKTDEILGYSIEELCLQDNENKLNVTRYTQPALYVVEALEYLKKLRDTNDKPDYVLGHSLGEYVALFAANVFDFITGLKLVVKRGELMHKAGNGGMAAVMGLNWKQIDRIIKSNGLYDISIANLNTSSQVVIAGPNKSIEAGKSIFKENGAFRYVVLDVSGAFHSPYMTDAAKEYRKYVSMLQLKAPEILVLSNYTARPYIKCEIVENLIQQIDNTVKWSESIEYLIDEGVNEFVQVGPGRTAISTVKQIQREVIQI